MDPASLSYSDLKNELKKRNVKISGTKAELQDTLASILKKESEVVASTPSVASTVATQATIPAVVPESKDNIQNDTTFDETVDQNEADIVDYEDIEDEDLVNDPIMAEVPSVATAPSEDVVSANPTSSNTVKDSTSSSVYDVLLARSKRFGTNLTPEALKKIREERFGKKPSSASVDPSIVARCQRFNLPIPEPKKIVEEHKHTNVKRNMRNSNTRRQNNNNNNNNNGNRRFNNNNRNNNNNGNNNNNRRFNNNNRNNNNGNNNNNRRFNNNNNNNNNNKKNISQFSNERRQMNNNNKQFLARKQRFAKQYDF